MVPPTATGLSRGRAALAADSIATIMMWSALLHPVGPEPVGVYWVRRFFAAIVLILVLVFLSWLLPSGGGHPKAAVATHTAAPRATTPPVVPRVTVPAATGPAATGAPAGSTATPACAAQDLGVSADADASDYPKGVDPRITISVKNVSANPCQIDLGSAARFLTISSGPDRVWSSADCASPTADVVTLTPGVVQAHTYLWPRNRSQPGCPAAANSTVAPPGTYLAQAHVGTITTPGAVLHLN